MPRLVGGPIAIVGMACRFPGAPDVSRFWQLVRDGRNAFRTPPRERWDHEAFFSTSQRSMDRYYAPTGAFIDDVRRFAAMEYGVAPRRLEVMDPQQRLSLEGGVLALQDAGYLPKEGRVGRSFDRSRAGTFIGVSALEWRSFVTARTSAALMAAGELGQAATPEEAKRVAQMVERTFPMRAFSAVGALANMVAATVAQELDLGGPAYTIDAACSSSLVAVHDAVTYLRDGQIDMAVAGGIYLNLIPDPLIAFSRIGAISASGVCRPFDTRADGFVLGEGVGMVVLKRLEDARRDGDRIYAVLTGSAVNNDGRGEGPMAPSLEGQQSVLRAAWADAGVTADQLGFIETHGTGTTVGDRTELNALKLALGQPAQPIPIGSVKANIGHTMSAAGIAGFMKTALALHYRTLPPLANWETPHEDLDRAVFVVPTRAAPWRSVTARRAIVSSFGFGGTNAHAVLEEPPPRARLFRSAAVESLLPLAHLPVLISADSAPLLARHLADLATTLPEAGEFAAVVHTLNRLRKVREVRVGIVADSLETLAERCRRAADKLAATPDFRGMLDADTFVSDAATPTPVAFLCPGQGMQKVGMLAEWLALPEFATTLEVLEREVFDLLPAPLTRYLYAADASDAALTDTAIAQPAMFAIGMAVAAVLQRLGVEPAVVLGHSLGEFTAAALCGAVAPADALRFVAQRGRAMADMSSEHGAMAAVMSDAATVAPLLPPEVRIANRNHATQVVLSGPTAAVQATVETLSSAGLKARMIAVSHAFHSPLMAAVQPVVDAALAAMPIQAPTWPMASCIAAAPIQSAAELTEVFRHHATRPVDYVRGLEQCAAAGARIFLQLSSGNTLVSFAKGTVDGVVLPIAGEGSEGGRGLARVLALLMAEGHALDLSRLGEGLATLPPVPLPTEEWWVVQPQAQKAPELVARATPATPVAESPVSTPAVAPTTSPSTDLRARALAIVAKVSAFPTDALRPEQKLLEDLGFDSLMIAELSTRLSESFPGFGGLPRALFAQSPTVADLLRQVEDTEGEAVPLTAPERTLGLYRPVLRPVAGPPVRGSAASILWNPDLNALRRLAPGDYVVAAPFWGSTDPNLAAIAGFVKSLAREWPQHKVCIVDGTAAEVEAEAGSCARDAEVVYRDGVRHIVGLTPIDAPASGVAGQRVLLSGGTGWLGQVLAKTLVEAGAEVIVLGTRENPGAVLTLPGVRYLRADVGGDLAALHGLSVDGIVHAAGLLADGPVGTVDGSRAWAVKVEGLRNLVSACAGVRWVVALGSYAGRFGNAFQTEYAAANNALTALCAELSAAGIAAQTQVWGPWADSTMVATVPMAVRRAMREDGVIFVDTAQGAAAFLAALGLDGEVVFGLDLPESRPTAEITEVLSPELPWLADHALMGRPTVPMAMVLQWAAELGITVLEDLTLFDGVVVEAPLTVRRRREGERFLVYAGSKLAWKGRVGSGRHGPVPDQEEGSAPTLSVSDFYAHHTFHGPALQGIVRVDAVGRRQVRGLVAVGAAFTGWLVSPLAVDSAFQLAAFWGQVSLGKVGFPTRLGRFWSAGPAPTETLVATVTVADPAAAHMHATVTLATPDGRLVAVVEGLEAELRSGRLDGSEATLEIPEEHRDFGKFPGWVDLAQRLEMASLSGITNPYFKVLDGVARDRIQIGGRELIHFSGYNYLGFSGHPYVEEQVIAAVRRYGTSGSASRVASGERPIHRELEAKLAKALGVEDAVVFSAGHATNVTAIGHLFGPRDLILHDELIHDSAFQGMKLSGATRRPFPHGDVRAAGRMLAQLRRNYEKALIIIEGVYSMDGDICDLPGFITLKKKYGAFLMVDEAHSFGVVGANGYGVREHFGVDGREVDIWMGTLSKSLSSCGGYIAGTHVLVELLKYTAPGFVYSAAISPANTAAAVASLDLMAAEPQHVAKLQANCRFFYEACQSHGLDTGPARGESAVIPVVVGNSYHALLLSDALFQRGINVQPILYPAVADNASRLRFFLSSLHSEAQLAWTAATVAAELTRIRENSL